MRALWLVILAVACSGQPSFRLERTLACDADYVDWAGGLTESLDQSPDGIFNYDPPGGVEARIDGDYDLGTGDFSWNVAYDPDHYRSSSTVSGFGYAATNGDLDIQYSLETTDVLGASWSVDVRETREGCGNAQIIQYADGTLVTETATISSARIDYERVYEAPDSEPISVSGAARSDLTWTENVDVNDSSGTYTATTEGDGDGYARSDWTESTTDYDANGYTEDFLDGSAHQSYDIDYSDTSATWDYTVDYEGNGSGTVSGDGFQCDLAFDAGACSYDCGEGTTGDC